MKSKILKIISAPLVIFGTGLWLYSGFYVDHNNKAARSDLYSCEISWRGGVKTYLTEEQCRIKDNMDNVSYPIAVIGIVLGVISAKGLNVMKWGKRDNGLV